MTSQKQLVSRLFAGDPRMDAAICAERPLCKGESGEAVKRLQVALLNLGFHCQFRQVV